MSFRFQPLDPAPPAKDTPQRAWLLIADAHVQSSGISLERFREMLRWIEGTEYDVVFLGDVMDLWVGVPRLQEPHHREFLEWCRREKSRRRILFLEGNHEFFVAAHQGDAFTACAEDGIALGDCLLAHGDMAAAPRGHRIFRWWSKSALAHVLLKWMPFAGCVVDLLKRCLERHGRKRKPFFPAAAFTAWAKALLASTPQRTALVGHFHHAFRTPLANNALAAALPAWKNRGEVALYEPKTGALLFQCWRNLPASPETLRSFVPFRSSHVVRETTPAKPHKKTH